MNKINFIFRALTCTVCAFTSGVAVYRGNIDYSHIEDNDVIAVEDIDSSLNNSSSDILEIKKEEAKSKDNSGSNDNTETKPEDENTSGDISSGPTGHTSTSNPATSEPAKPAPNPTVKQYNSLAEWEADVMGVCPSQRPAYAQTGHKSYLPAIGISGLGQPNTPNRAVELTWNDMKIYGASNAGALGTYGMIINDRSCSNDNYSFKINWATNTVEWYMTWGGAKPQGTDISVKLDNLANQMTARLQWVVSAYNSKCPNN